MARVLLIDELHSHNVRITLTIQGGTTPGRRLPSRTVLLTRLDPSTAATVRALAATVRSETTPASGAPSDGQSYVLQIEEQGDVTEVKAHDATMSPAFAKLLELIEDLD